MHIEAFRKYCLSKPYTSEDTPFDEYTLALRVGGKIFALTGLDNIEFKVNLKCNPDKAIELREQYTGIQPGYHMNKQHWNTVHFESDVPEKVLLEMIDHSYELVFNSLTGKQKQALLNG
jgi:predicted DNA-binding protein (MmcQ/YjbR family)